LFQTILNKKLVRQIFAYLDSAVGMRHIFLALLVSWEYHTQNIT